MSSPCRNCLKRHSGLAGSVLVMYVQFIVAISILLYTAISAQAQPDEKAGHVAFMRGEVTAVGEKGGERRLKQSSPVYIRDTIRTGAESRIQMIFHDNTIISLGPASRMEIADYAWTGRGGTGRMKTRVQEGAFRILGGAITKHSPEKFKTETPLATIGIRGSMYAGLVKDGFMQVVLEGGIGIYVQNRGGQVELTTPGEGTTVTGPGASPDNPRHFSSDEIADIMKRVGLPSSAIHNRSSIHNSGNLELGTGSRANMGTVTVRPGSSVSGEIMNESRIQDTDNAAMGRDNEASVGSIVIE